MSDIDLLLDSSFSPERIIQAFLDYKRAKWDYFTGFDEPEINIPIGADGVKFEAFEKQLNRNARNISHRIRSGRYTFFPFRQVEIRKDTRFPFSDDNKRVLGIASIRDALVQAILYKEVLNSRTEIVFRSLDNPEPLSFAYRSGKSAPLAALLIYSYSQEDYIHIYDADLRKFFDLIPHDNLLEKIADLLGGDSSRTYQLVRRFVRVDRVPFPTYKHARHRGRRVGYKIFHWKKPIRQKPKPSTGIPQGGVLSGMLANLYLHEFDEWIATHLAGLYDIKYARYADDFIVMAKDPSILPKVDHEISEYLLKPSLKLQVNREKTGLRDLRTDGLNFIGFHFSEKHLRVRNRNIQRFRNRLSNEIFERIPPRILEEGDYARTLRWLIFRINSKIEGLHRRMTCPMCRCEYVGPPRNWISFFKVVTDTDQLRMIDKWIRESIYHLIFHNHGVRLKRRDLSNHPHGKSLRSLVNEMFHNTSRLIRPCLCQIMAQNRGIWPFVRSYFQGREFRTLARGRSFHVPFVSSTEIQISVNRRQYSIERETFVDLWERIQAGQRIRRVDLERQGVRATSQLVALLGSLPGVIAEFQPITLVKFEEPPAGFLIIS